MNIRTDAESSTAAAGGFARAMRGDEIVSDIARDMACKFDDLFLKVFLTPRKAEKSAAGHIFFCKSRHDVVYFNRNLAARWASRSMPAKAIEDWFLVTGLERRKDLFIALKVSPSKVSRAGPDKALDPSVTERMLRQSDLFVRAAEVFGDEGKTWMTKPHELLDGKAPVEYAANEFGGAKVRAMLNAIEYGGVV